MERLLLVGAGGFAGAVLRYVTSRWLHGLLGTAFPYGTLVVNLLGCAAIGAFLGLVELRADLPGGVKELVVFGLLGGFTTFSAFGYEVEELLREGETARALLYVAASVLLGVLLAFAGRAGVLFLGR